MMESESEGINRLLQEGTFMHDINTAFINYNSNLSRKSVEKSEKFRKDGNALFRNHRPSFQVHEQIWELYTKSISAAPNNSEELALALSNRSTVLLHLGLYDYSIVDIDEALICVNSIHLKIKLYCRKVHCLVAINDLIDVKEILRKVLSYLEEIQDQSEKELYLSLYEKAKKVFQELRSRDLKKIKKYKISSRVYGIEMKVDGDKKYLTASKDLKPGEIIFVEKYFAVCINFEKSHTFCNHCLAFSWTSIPCSFCSDSMYCSKKCREEAWKSYHKTECILQSALHLQYFDRYTRLVLRALLKGLSEAGSIENFKKILESTNEENSNNKISFKNLFNLKTIFNEEFYQKSAKTSVLVTIFLVKLGTIFQEGLKLDKKNLMANEDVVFICKLLFRTTMIIRNNFIEISDSQAKCDHGSSCLCGVMTDRPPRGIGIIPKASYFQHNCNPNAEKIFTNDGQVMYYSIRPIKNGTLVTEAHFGDYSDTFIEERQKKHQEKFYTPCTCMACQLQWSKATFRYELQGMFSKSPSDPIELLKMEFLSENFQAVEAYEDDYFQFSKATFKEFIKGIEYFYRKFSVMVTETESMIIAQNVHLIFDRMYGMVKKFPTDCQTI